MRRLWITLLRAACGDDDVIMDASVDTARDATNLETDANEGFDAGCTRDEDCPLSGGTGQGAPLMASDIDMIGGQRVLLGLQRLWADRPRPRGRPFFNTPQRVRVLSP